MQGDRALGALLLSGLLTAACGGDDDPAARSAAPASSPGSESTAPSVTPAPSTAAAPTAGRTIAQDGVRVQVPQGWQGTALTERARAEALAREDDPRVKEFLEGRMAGLAAEGAVLYLYDLRAVASGDLATAEVYRYPAGRTPEEALEVAVLPALQQAGLTAVRGETVLPAGRALTATTSTEASGKSVRNEFFVLQVGPTPVGLSVTTVGAPRTGTATLAQSLSAG